MAMYSLDVKVEGEFLFCRKQTVEYTDKKDQSKKSFDVFKGALLSDDDRIIEFQCGEDPKLTRGEKVAMTGYVKHDKFSNSLVFVAK